MKLAPAILTQSTQDFARLTELAKTMSIRVQLDYIDGEFVNNTTIGLSEMRTEGLTVDLDLMAANPSKHEQEIVALKPALVVLHIEANEDIQPTLRALREQNIRVGVALNASTEFARVQDLLSEIDHVLVMGYDAGFAGQTFNEACLSHITEAKKLAPNLEVGVDGGVNEQSIPKIKQAGADIAYVNSAVFGADDPVATFKQLEEMAR